MQVTTNRGGDGIRFSLVYAGDAIYAVQTTEAYDEHHTVVRLSGERVFTTCGDDLSGAHDAGLAWIATMHPDRQTMLTDFETTQSAMQVRLF